MLKTTAETSSRAIDNSSFLTFLVKLVFSQLIQVFTKALILYHINLEYHIHIETNIFGYAIGGILNQLTLESGQ